MGTIFNQETYEIRTFNTKVKDVDRFANQFTGISATVREIHNKQCAFKGYLFHNNNSARVWIQIFFKPSDEVELGVTAPDLTVSIGATASVAWDMYQPIIFGTGLSIAASDAEVGTTVTTAVTGTILYAKQG